MYKPNALYRKDATPSETERKSSSTDLCEEGRYMYSLVCTECALATFHLQEEPKFVGFFRNQDTLHTCQEYKRRLTPELDELVGNTVEARAEVHESEDEHVRDVGAACRLFAHASLQNRRLADTLAVHERLKVCFK